MPKIPTFGASCPAQWVRLMTDTILLTIAALLWIVAYIDSRRTNWRNWDEYF